MKVIGITGGVGSGKSYIAEILRVYCNAELLIADEIGHLVMKKGNKCYEELVEKYGKLIVMQDGEIARDFLADITFGDPDKLNELNNIVHPYVKCYIETYIEM